MHVVVNNAVVAVRCGASTAISAALPTTSRVCQRGLYGRARSLVAAGACHE